MYSVLGLITLAFIAIVISAFIIPLHLSRRTKAILCVLVCILPCKSYLSLIVGGTAFDPEIPYNLTFVTDLGRSTLIFLALCVLLRLIINLITKLVKRSKSANLIPPQSPFYALLIFILAFALAAYGTSCGYGHPQLQKYTITLDKLDPSLDGMKIIQLADIHVSAPTDAKVLYNMVQRINALEPDLILIPGDLIDGAVQDRRPIIDLLLLLQAKYGVFISTGNHEYYSGYQSWRNYFEQGGFTSLDNKVITLFDAQGKALLNLAGLTDEAAARFNLPLPDIKGVTAALDATAPSIVLSHRPQYATQLAGSGKVDLVLSGHTHGGLVIGLNKLVAKANGGFVSGLYDLANKTKLIVSNGTMIWMGFPLRIGVPSQIIEITLQAKNPPNSQTVMLTRAAELKHLAAQKAAQLQAQQQQSQNNSQAAQSTQYNGQKQNISASNISINNAPVDLQNASVDLQQVDQQTAHDAFAQSPKLTVSQNKANATNQNPQDLTSVQLILPMENTKSGEIKENIMSLAVLPNNLTEDQIQRINDIINEKPEDKKTAEKSKLQSDSAPVKPLVHFKVLKNDLKQSDSTAQKQTQHGTPSQHKATSKPDLAPQQGIPSQKGTVHQQSASPQQSEASLQPQPSQSAPSANLQISSGSPELMSVAVSSTNNVFASHTLTNENNAFAPHALTNESNAFAKTAAMTIHHQAALNAPANNMVNIDYAGNAEYTDNEDFTVNENGVANAQEMPTAAFTNVTIEQNSDRELVNTAYEFEPSLTENKQNRNEQLENEELDSSSFNPQFKSLSAATELDESTLAQNLSPIPSFDSNNFQHQYGDDPKHPDSLSDSVTMEMQLLYSLSLGSESSLNQPETHSVQDLLK